MRNSLVNFQLGGIQTLTLIIVVDGAIKIILGGVVTIITTIKMDLDGVTKIIIIGEIIIAQIMAGITKVGGPTKLYHQITIIVVGGSQTISSKAGGNLIAIITNKI